MRVQIAILGLKIEIATSNIHPIIKIIGQSQHFVRLPFTQITIKNIYTKSLKITQKQILRKGALDST